MPLLALEPHVLACKNRLRKVARLARLATKLFELEAVSHSPLAIHVDCLALCSQVVRCAADSPAGPANAKAALRAPTMCDKRHVGGGFVTTHDMSAA